MTTWLTDTDGDLINTDAIAFICVREFWERVKGADGKPTRQVTGYQVVAVMQRPTPDGGAHSNSPERAALTDPTTNRADAERQRNHLAEMLLTYSGEKIVPMVYGLPPRMCDTCGGRGPGDGSEGSTINCPRCGSHPDFRED